MKLFELNFTLLREFEELKDLFNLFNLMVIVKNSHITISIKTEDNIYFAEINLYGGSQIPLISIKEKLESPPLSDTWKNLSELTNLINSNSKNVYLKFNIKEAKYVAIEVYDTIYEYDESENQSISNMSPFDYTKLEEIFTFKLKVYKSFPYISEFINIVNSMFANNYVSFIILRSKLLSEKAHTEQRNLYINLFNDNITYASLAFNASLHKESNLSKLTKYNTLCSQIKNNLRIYITIDKFDKHENPILKVHVFSPKELSNKVIEKCKLIDMVTP